MNDDTAHMARALALGRTAANDTDPNPRVGCVLIAPDGRLIGQGCTQRAGGPHAEIMALRDAQAAGENTRGASAYVTLEPCAHHGRTPPCADALLAAGIARVIAALPDPNPRVAGQGLARLRAAGVQVQAGACPQAAQQAFEDNIGFFSRMVRRRPWVRLKMAASLDGITALADGQSQWITSAAARADGHHWRTRASAILTGSGTVRHDNPQLTARPPGPPPPRQPALILLDSQLRTPLTARLWQTPARPVHLCTTIADPARHAPYQALGAHIHPLPASASGQISLPALPPLLAQLEINELHVEAGHTLAGALLQAELVDECLLYLAPCLLGPGQSLAALPPLPHLNAALRLRFHEIRPLGDDLRLRARPPERENFWPEATQFRQKLSTDSS